MYNKKILVVATVLALVSFASQAQTKYTRAGGFKTVGTGLSSTFSGYRWGTTGSGAITFTSATGACTNCGAAFDQTSSGVITGTTYLQGGIYSGASNPFLGGAPSFTSKAASFSAVTMTLGTASNLTNQNTANYSYNPKSVGTVPFISRSGGVFTPASGTLTTIATPTDTSSKFASTGTLESYKTGSLSQMATVANAEIGTINSLVSTTNTLISTFNGSATSSSTNTTGAGLNAQTAITNLKSEIDYARSNLYYPIIGAKANWTTNDVTTNAATYVPTTGNWKGGVYTTATTTDTHTITINGTTYNGRLVFGGYFKAGTTTKAVSSYDAVPLYFVDYSQAIQTANTTMISLGGTTAPATATVTMTSVGGTSFNQ